MKKQLLIIIFTCAWIHTQAQVNFVVNPSFENYSKCPDDINQLINAVFWSCAVDTIGEPS